MFFSENCISVSRMLEFCKSVWHQCSGCGL